MNKKLRLFAAAAGMMLLILDAKTAAEASRQAVEICIRTVIPSLFPFFLLSGYLTGSFQGGSWAARLFRSHSSCGGVILTGLLAGYPVGAKAAAEANQTGALSRQQADRLLYFCSQAGPSFLFGMVAAQFDGPQFAWSLWGIQILCALTVANLIPEVTISFSSIEMTDKKNLDPMQSALRAMASVCGWVIVFAIVIQFCKRWVLWLLPVELQVLISGLLELTNGCLMLNKIQNPDLRFLIAAVMLNFGGLCVLLQTASVAGELRLGNYLKGKLLQTCFAFLYSLPFPGKWFAFVPIIFIYFFGHSGFSIKRCSIPEKNSV